MSVSGDKVTRAAMSLLGRLRITHSSKEYRKVWEVAQASLGKYEGITYTKQMADLDEALKAHLISDDETRKESH